MDDSYGCRWSPKTQGYTSSTRRSANTKSVGMSDASSSTLCLGAGRAYDKAEAARVAAEEFRAEQIAAQKIRLASGERRAMGMHVGKKHAPRPSSGWLSERARSCERAHDRGPRKHRPDKDPLTGPYDPRHLVTTHQFKDHEEPDLVTSGERRPQPATTRAPPTAPGRSKSIGLSHLPGHGGPTRKKGHGGWDVDAWYSGKDPKDHRPIDHTRINGGIRTPAVWDDKTHGFVGTDRMRHQPDSMGHRALLEHEGTRFQEGEIAPYGQALTRSYGGY